MADAESQDKKQAPYDERVRSGSVRAGGSPTVPADVEASKDLAELLDRTDRLLSTGPSRGSRVATGGTDRINVQSAEVRDGDRLSAQAF